MKWLPIIIICLLIQRTINAQSYLRMGIQFTGGSFLTTRSKAELIRDSYVTLGEIYLEKQTSGERKWERAHQLPSYGIGYVFGNSGSRQYIGNIYAVAGFIKTPVISSHTFFKISAGPGVITKPFDIYTNPKNTMVGSRLNAYIMLTLSHQLLITPQLSAEGGISFMHLSNGGTSLPNAGLNVPAISLGINYAFQKPEIGVDYADKDDYSKNWKYQFIYSMGTKQAPWIGSKHHFIQALSFEVQKHFGISHSYGGGASAYINNSIPFNPLLTPADKQNERRFQLLVYGLYEHHFGNLSIPIHAGAYVYNSDRFPIIFEEFGIRYQFTKHLGSQVMLKIHTGQADFIHSGISYAL